MPDSFGSLTTSYKSDSTLYFTLQGEAALAVLYTFYLLLQGEAALVLGARIGGLSWAVAPAEWWSPTRELEVLPRLYV